MQDSPTTLWSRLASELMHLPVGQVLLAIVIVVAAIVAARVVGTVLHRLRTRSKASAPVIYVFEKLAIYSIVLGGLFIGLSTLGVNLTSLAVFAGAVGVGIGLGLQGIVREFVSGLLIIFDPFIQVGDFVELESGLRGEIMEVGPRATLLKTNDGLNVIIPNSKLIDNQVVNWTYRGGTRRIHVPFGVAYGADKVKVREVVLEAARAVPFTLADSTEHKTQVWLTGFGDSSLNFELVVWPTFDAVKRPSAMHAAYTWAIEDALRKADIEIPFPQMDLRLRSLFGRENSEALRAMGFKDERPPAENERPATDAKNDAAEDLLADAALEAERRAAEDTAED